MEFPQIGSHCTMETCNVLDFLPVSCPLCEKVFCGSHRLPMDHECIEWTRANKQLNQCPTCQKLLSSKDLTPEDTVSKHIGSGCKLYLYVQPPALDRILCNVPGCKELDPKVGPVHCDGCRGDFCLGHRHPSSHDCSGPMDKEREKEQRKLAIQEKLSRTFKTAPTAKKTTPPSQSTKPKSNRIQLMILKRNAKPGDLRNWISEASRIYLYVQFPRDSKLGPQSMYFDKSSSVGKTLDLIASYGKIRNENNLLAQNDDKRLALHNADTQAPLDNAMTLENALTDQDTIILERRMHMVHLDKS